MKKAYCILFSKKTLYILCFMALNLIELLKGSQTGAVWYVAVNCTGLVVMVMVASGWPLKDFLTVGNGIYTLFCIAVMILIGWYWHPTTGQYVLWQLETAVMNVWWLGIIWKYLLRKIIIEKTLALKPDLIGWIWIIMTGFMICSASKRLWPLWFLLMFGAFYLTLYKDEDKKVLWNAMIDGTILSFFFIQIYAYGFRPYDEVRYEGAFANSNMAALYYLIVYFMCLYKLHLLELRKAHKLWKLFYLIGAGGMLSFQLFTMGRTAWVVSIVITILYGIMAVKKIWGKTWKQTLYRGCMLILAAAVTFFPVYYTIRWMPTIMHHPIWYEGEYSVNKVHSFDSPDSEKYISLDEFLNVLFLRVKNTLHNGALKDPFLLRAYAAADADGERVELLDIPGLDDSLNIRLSIYKAYLEDLTWFGHGPDEGFYYIGTGEYHSWHAQNLWIQVAYTYGIPAGIFMILLTVVMIWRQKKKVNAIEEFSLFPFLISIIFFLFGSMEIVWNPGQLILFLVFFVQHPQMGRAHRGR